MIGDLFKPKPREALFAGAFAAVAGLLIAFGLAQATDGGPKEDKRSVVRESHELQMPADYARTGATRLDRSQLPTEWGQFAILPSGSIPERSPSYGDSRDAYVYKNASAKDWSGLPANDPLVRTPVLPDAYVLQSLAYTVGTAEDGSASTLSEVHATYSDGVHVDIDIALFRPTDLAQGRKYEMVAMADESQLVLDVGEVRGLPAVYLFPRIDHLGGALEEVTLADGDVIIVVSSYQGINFQSLIDIAGSLVAKP